MSSCSHSVSTASTKLAESFLTSKSILFITSVMVKCSRQELSLAWSGKIRSMQQTSRSAKLLLVNQVLTTRRVHMIRWCSEISFRSSCFNKVFFKKQRLHQMRKRLHPQQQSLQIHLQQTSDSTPPGLPQPQQIKTGVTGKQTPSEFEINMTDSLKEGILEINEKSINSDQSEVVQELQFLQDLKLQEWYQGDLQGYS